MQKKIQAEDTDTADETDPPVDEDDTNKEGRPGGSGNSSVETWTPEDCKRKRVTNADLNREELQLKRDRNDTLTKSMKKVTDAHISHLQAVQPVQKEPQDADTLFGNTVVAQMKLVIMTITNITVEKLIVCLSFVNFLLRIMFPIPCFDYILQVCLVRLKLSSFS